MTFKVVEGIENCFWAEEKESFWSHYGQKSYAYLM